MIPIKYRPKIKQDGEGRVGRNLEEPSDQLMERFEQYLERVEDYKYGNRANYFAAHDFLEPIEFNLNQVTSLLQIYSEDKPHNFESDTGPFLSAAHNLSDQQLLVYDLETEHRLTGIGCKLNSDNTLVLKSDATNVGEGSQGTILNLADTTRLSDWNKGLCINSGRAEDTANPNFGVIINLGSAGNIRHCTSYGLVLNFGEVDSFLDYDFPGTYLTKTEFSDKVKRKSQNKDNWLNREDIYVRPKLDQYLEELETSLRQDWNSVIDFLDQLGPKPGDKIKEKVSELRGEYD